jgi:hypothetical protein
MRAILKRVGIGAVAVGAAIGLAMVGGGAASAGTGYGGFTAMSCEPGTTGSGQARMDCEIGSYYYLHHIRANQIAPGNPFDAGVNIPCTVGGASNTYGYNELSWAAAADPNAKYKVTITACAFGGGTVYKDVYKVDQSGNVTLLHTNAL